MRAFGQDIVELFGYSPDDTSQAAKDAFHSSDCPFVQGSCSKTNHDCSIVYGTCSVTTGKQKQEAIICPKRLYAEGYRTLYDASSSVWPGINLIIGGSMETLIRSALEHDECAIAFGQNSGKEISIDSNGKLSMDWIIQRYIKSNGNLTPVDFIGIEVQSIDITGNYRENWQAYYDLKIGVNRDQIPNAGHGLNWANVHKRLIPQIIRKGNIYSQSARCAGFFFLLPDLVYSRFESVLGTIKEQETPSKNSLSVITYELGTISHPGNIRQLERKRTKHHLLDDIARSFISNSGPDVASRLDRALIGLI
jgi:hypothetical protein